MAKQIFMGSTEVDVAKTIGDIMGVLGRYPRVRRVAQHWEGGGPSGIEFSIELAGGLEYAYRLPVRVDAVHEKLQTLRGYKYAKSREQAARVAWRQVLRWLEAQLAMIETGNSSTEEIFMPFMLNEQRTQTYFEAFREQQVKQLAAAAGGGAP